MSFRISAERDGSDATNDHHVQEVPMAASRTSKTVAVAGTPWSAMTITGVPP
jgi:hypothetical protein